MIIEQFEFHKRRKEIQSIIDKGRIAGSLLTFREHILMNRITRIIVERRAKEQREETTQ